jgi:recombinational DNA repair protein RecR
VALEFHVHIHASHSNASLQSRVKAIGDLELPVLVGFSPTTQFSSTFEETAERLQDLPGLFLEPDGSFAWNQRQAHDREQLEHLEGTLYDRNERVEYCEVKGECSQRTMCRFLASLKGATEVTVIQFAHEGVFVEEQVFLGLWRE